MAPAFVNRTAQGSSGTSGTVVSPAVSPAAVPAGDLLVAVSATNSAVGVETMTITDSASGLGVPNVWQEAFNVAFSTGSFGTLHVHTCLVTKQIAVADSITQTVGAATSRRSLGVWRFSGFLQPLVRVNRWQNNVGTTLGSFPVTPLATGGLLVYCIAENTGANAGQTLTGATNGFTISLGGNNSGGGSVARETNICYLVPSGAPASTSTAPTDAGSPTWIGAMLSIEEGAFASNPLYAHRRTTQV